MLRTRSIRIRTLSHSRRKILTNGNARMPVHLLTLSPSNGFSSRCSMPSGTRRSGFKFKPTPTPSRRMRRTSRSWHSKLRSNLCSQSAMVTVVLKFAEVVVAVVADVEAAVAVAVEVRARRLAISPCPALTAGRWSAIAGWNARKRTPNISRRRNSNSLRRKKLTRRNGPKRPMPPRQR